MACHRAEPREKRGGHAGKNGTPSPPTRVEGAGLPDGVEEALRGTGVDCREKLALLTHLYRHTGRRFEPWQLPGWKPMGEGIIRALLEGLVARGIVRRSGGPQASRWYWYDPGEDQRKLLEPLFVFLEGRRGWMAILSWLEDRAPDPPDGQPDGPAGQAGG